MKRNTKTDQLWAALLGVAAEHDRWSETAFFLNYVVERFNATVPPLMLSAKLQELIRRSTNLAEEWETYSRTIEQQLHTAAWRFAAHAFDLRPGDRLTCVDRRPPVLVADALYILDSTVGHLGLRARVPKKNGQLSPREYKLTLFDTVWRKITPPWGTKNGHDDLREN